MTFDWAAKRADVAARANEKRLNPTQAEAEALRVFSESFGRDSFAFQRVIGFYIVDFLFRAEKVVVEIDGASHDTLEAQLHDAERRGYLRGRGYHVVHVQNDTIFRDPSRVVYVVGELRKARTARERQVWSWYTRL